MNIKKNIRKLLSPRKQKWQRFLKDVESTPGKKAVKDKPEWTKNYFKAYARVPYIQLPKPDYPKSTFKKIMSGVSSSHNFTTRKLPLAKLNTLIYYSMGIRDTQVNGDDILHRYYPSAGARYPIEAYLFLQNTEGLLRGVYHYYVKDHIFEQIDNTLPDLTEYFVHPYIAKASAFIVLTSVFLRTTFKYGNRGYNYALLEAGHIGQNIYLLSSALNMTVCPIGGFYEDKINTLLDLDSSYESVIYIFAVE